MNGEAEEALERYTDIKGLFNGINKELKNSREG